MFEQILHLYTDYIRLDARQKLYAGKLLAEAARMLLAMDSQKLNLEQRLQRCYLMRNIAADLLSQMMDMACTKQYDCDPVLNEYITLAFNLMYEFCEKKPGRLLLPYIKEMIAILQFHDDEEGLNKLKELLKRSIDDEEKYLKFLREFIDE